MKRYLAVESRKEGEFALIFSASNWKDAEGFVSILNNTEQLSVELCGETT